jgi:cell division GTPase FtsZ
MNKKAQHDGCKRIAIAGIGDVGFDILKHLEPYDAKHPLLFRINWDDCIEDLDDKTIDIALDSRLRGFTKGDPVAAANAMSEVASKFHELTNMVSFFLLIAQPADGVGSGVTTELAGILRRRNIPFMSTMILPDAESCSRKQLVTASSTIVELCHMRETPVVFDPAEFPGYNDAFKSAVVEKIQLLLDAMSPGMIQIDFNRIRTALCGASRSTIVTARAKGKCRAREAAAIIMADYSLEPLLNHEACVLMHIQTEGALSLHEVEEIATYIADNWGNSIDLIYGVGNGVCEKDELRLGLIAAEDLNVAKEIDNECMTMQALL